MRNGTSAAVGDGLSATRQTDVGAKDLDSGEDTAICKEVPASVKGLESKGVDLLRGKETEGGRGRGRGRG